MEHGGNTEALAKTSGPMFLGQTDPFCRVSMHVPSIPSKHMTFFYKKDKKVGFGTGASKAFRMKNDDVWLKESGKALIDQSLELADRGVKMKKRAPAPKAHSGSLSSQQKYFRYIFVGKVGQERAKVTSNGLIQLNGKEPVSVPKSKSLILLLLKSGKERLKGIRNKTPATQIKDSQNEEEDEANEFPKGYDPLSIVETRNTSNHDHGADKPKRRKNTLLLSRCLSNASVLKAPNLNESISAKHLKIESKGERASVGPKLDRPDHSKLCLPNVVRNYSDVSKLSKELRKHSLMKAAVVGSCPREDSLLQKFKSSRPQHIVKTEYIPKENIEQGMNESMPPGPGKYEVADLWTLKDASISKRGTSTFASMSSKAPVQKREGTEAIYYPLLPPDKISFQVNFGNQWV